jgi:streptogramin lyase
MLIETPQFSGFAQGAVAVTTDGSAHLATAAVTTDSQGAAAITSYGSTPYGGFLSGDLTYTNFNGALSPMTADSLGNLWFAGNPYEDSFYGYIARVPEGDLGEPGSDQPVVRLSSTVNSVTAIATDRSGDAWVSAWPLNGTPGQDNEIFHVSAALKVVRAYKVPPGTQIAGIVVGADNAIWFLDSTHNAIGRMTRAGKFSHYDIPTPNSGVSAITLGADGALWFTESNANKIGRISTSKHVTEYSLLTKNADPTGIAALGPGCNSGVVWFIEQRSQKLGMLTI